MIQVTITVENNSSYTCFLSFLSNQFTYFGSLFFLRHFFSHTQRRSGSQSLTGQIVDNLNIDLLIASKHTHTRTFSCT